MWTGVFPQNLSQIALQPSIDVGADVISGRDGSTVWSRDAAAGERLVPARADLDGDAAADVFALRAWAPEAPARYSVVSGRDAGDVWPAARVFEGDGVVTTFGVLEIDAAAGADILEAFSTQTGPSGALARPGRGGSPIWVR